MIVQIWRPIRITTLMTIMVTSGKSNLWVVKRVSLTLSRSKIPFMSVTSCHYRNEAPNRREIPISQSDVICAAHAVRALNSLQLPEQYLWGPFTDIQYIPRNMHTVFALLCFVVVIHWLIFPYPLGLLHWHCGNLTIDPVPAKQPWWIWINTSYEFIMNDCITTTKQSTTKPCAYFLGYTVVYSYQMHR